MPTEFTMPKLGLTMEEGTIVEWLVPDGTVVDEGTPVLVVQTDKVETEVNVVGSGRLVHVAAPGETLACGERVGLLLGAGESAGSTSTEPAPPSTSQRLFASPNARRVAAERGVDLARVRGTGPGGRIVSEDVEEWSDPPAAAPSEPTPVVASPDSGRPFVPATFAARSLADLLGVDIATVAADPRDGRVTRDDVARHIRRLLGAGRDAAPALPAATQSPSKVVPLRGMRGTIAKRMHASLREMAQLTLTMDADVDAVAADRAERAASGAAPGWTDYVIAAAARALREYPMVNAQLTDEGIALLPDVHVGLAVAVDGGLVVPVLRDADRLSVDEIAERTTELAAAARSGSLSLEQFEGGTFSVSALGMYGVDAFTPVINPPNVAILGVGRVRDDVVVVEGAVTTTARLTLSLTWDHRVLDGAPAAEFTRSIAGYLADPASLAG